jgi:hypothetical protein
MISEMAFQQRLDDLVGQVQTKSRKRTVYADPWSEKRTFPIELGVGYRCVKSNRLSSVGVGKTIEISRHEVDFTTQHSLNPGERIRLSVDWPAMLGNTCPMKLEICGRVVRSEPGRAAIQIARYEFLRPALARTAEHYAR